MPNAIRSHLARVAVPKSQFTDAYDVFRKVIADVRRRQNLTQVQLAESIGKPQSWVSAYETGLRRLDVIEFIAITRALDVDAVRLFREINSKVPSKLDI